MRHAIDNTLDRPTAESAMRRAIDLSRSHRPHPNPRVGAVILGPDGSVRAVGVHRERGLPHAEREALASAGGAGDTMVVTLEPCDHEGTTPPCTEAIVASGIRRVVVGAIDPDVRVAGRGIARLRAAGIVVDEGVLADEVEAADPAYFHHRRTGRARITLKLASTLDGQVAALDGTSRWITSPESRADVHRLRSEHDAVLVGIGTVLADDPMLDVRLPGYSGPQPRPVVLRGTRTLPSDAGINARDPIVLGDEGGADPIDVAHRLPDHGILGVLVEGGPTIARAFLDAGAVDEVVWYLGARLAGGVGFPAIGGEFATLADGNEITIDDVTRLGPDVRIRAHLTTQEGI